MAALSNNLTEGYEVWILLEPNNVHSIGCKNYSLIASIEIQCDSTLSHKPTRQPTKVPSHQPTQSPTTAPTLAPTRNPTKKIVKFDGYLNCELFFYTNKSTLDYIDDELIHTNDGIYKYSNTKSNSKFVQNIESLVEKNYLTQISTLEEYKDFDVIINRFLLDTKEYKITKNGIVYKDVIKQNLKRLLLQITKANFKIYYEIWTSTAFKTNFEVVQNGQLRGVADDLTIYFGHRNVTFIKSKFINFVKIAPLTFLERLLGDLLLLVNIGFIIFAIIVQIFALVYVKTKTSFRICRVRFYETDVFKYKEFIIFCLQIWDFISDIIFCRDVYKKHSNNPKKNNYAIMFYFSLVFIIVPWILNLIQIVNDKQNINQIISKNNYAKLWYMKNKKFLFYLVALTGGLYPSLTMVNSKLFGLQIFNMSLSKTEILSFQSIKLKYTVLCENLPQFVLQLYFLTIDTANLSFFSTWLAITSSVFSMISLLLSYLLNDMNSLKIKRYTISVDFHNAKKTSILVQKISKKKMLLESLKVVLLKVINGANDTLDIVYVNVTSNGLDIVFDDLSNKNPNLQNLNKNKLEKLNHLIHKFYKIDIKNNNNKCYPIIIKLQKLDNYKIRLNKKEIISEHLNNDNLNEESISFDNEKYYVTVTKKMPNEIVTTVNLENKKVFINGRFYDIDYDPKDDFKDDGQINYLSSLTPIQTQNRFGFTEQHTKLSSVKSDSTAITTDDIEMTFLE